jgi:atypical protein kinase C zeta type
MQIIKIPPRVTFYEFLSDGAVGWVFKINDRIILKHPTHLDSEGFQKGNGIF